MQSCIGWHPIFDDFKQIAIILNPLISNYGWFAYNLINNLRMQKNIIGGKSMKETEGVEISAHRAPSEAHAKVQGCIFTEKEFDKLQDGKEAKDIDGVKHQISEPIEEGDCKHTAMPFLIGVSEPSNSKEYLKELLEENEKGIEVQGKHFTLYQAKIEAQKLKEQIKDETDKAKKADLRSLHKELKAILDTKAIRVK